MQSTHATVEVDGVTRSFGRRSALGGISLSLQSGDCLALFGPNGAGKTTLLRVVAGLLKPTSGIVRVGGHSLRDDASARARVGLVSHQSMLYRALTARENLEFTAKLYGLENPRAAADRALERMHMSDRANAPVRALSRGLQQRISIARAIVHDPSVVLLDEPYTGLDAAGSAALTETLRLLRSHGATMMLVTHNVDEGLEIATHAAIMTAGRIVRYEDCTALDAAGYVTEYRNIVLGIDSMAKLS
jgi:heme exporter protein A